MKAVKVLAIAVVLLAVSFLFLKDLLLKSFIEHYAASELGIECGIKNASLSLKEIFLKGVSVSHKGFDLKMNRASIYLLYGRGVIPGIHRIDLKGVKADIFDFDETRKFVLNKAGRNTKETGSTHGGGKAYPLDIDISNADIRIASPGMFEIKGLVSFRGRFFRQRITDWYYADISQGRIKIEGFSSQFSLSPTGPNRYIFKMSGMKMKDKEIPGLSFYLYPESLSVHFKGIDTPLLGDKSLVKGVMDTSNYSKVCIDADFDKSSFEKIVDLFSGKESLSFRGIFRGELKLCLAGGISGLSGEFINKKGGLIKIKKEASLSFLKKYLDLASYQALISNLKNYSYNKGKINITQKEKAVIVNMNFYSPDLGKRNLTVTLHNF